MDESILTKELSKLLFDGDSEKAYQLFLNWILKIPDGATVFLESLIQEVNNYSKNLGRPITAKNPLGNEPFQVKMDFALGEGRGRGNKLDLVLTPQDSAITGFIGIELKVRSLESANQTVKYFAQLDTKFHKAIQEGKYLCLFITLTGLLPTSESFLPLNFLGLYGALEDTIDHVSRKSPEAGFLLNCLYTYLIEKFNVPDVEGKLALAENREKVAQLFRDKPTLIQNNTHGIILAAYNRLGRKVEQEYFGQYNIKYIGVSLWGFTGVPLLTFQKRPGWTVRGDNGVGGTRGQNVYFYIFPAFRGASRVNVYLYDEQQRAIVHHQRVPGSFLDLLFFDANPAIFRQLLADLEKIDVNKKVDSYCVKVFPHESSSENQTE